MADENPEPRGFIRARPLRVAYLLAENEHGHEMLDAIFAECLSRWGGRFSLIVPCEGGAPRSAYLPWLVAYDPDIIYSFIDLDEKVLNDLRETLGPAFLVRHHDLPEENPQPHDFKPHLPLDGLSSLSTALPYMRAFPASAPQPIRLVDYAMGEPHDRFIGDNFGAYYSSFSRWPIPQNLGDAIKPLAVASPKVRTNPQVDRSLKDAEVVSDATELLNFMAAKGNAFGLAQLAADAAPHLQIRQGHRDAFTIVVGDTWSDRVYYWNVRSRLPAYPGRQAAVLIIPQTRIGDDQFFAAVTEFLKTRNGIHGNQGPPWIVLQSLSQTKDQLEAVKDRFRTFDKWNGYHVGQETSLDGLAPTDAELKNQVGDLVGSGFFDRGWGWKDFIAAGKSARPPTVLPVHLQSVPEMPFATNGVWALDLDIERHENLSRYANADRWRFPRRLRFCEAFCKPYVGNSSSQSRRQPRSTKEGFLSLFVELGEQPPAIDLPADDVAIRTAVRQGNTWPPFRSNDPWPTPTGPYGWAQPSDKGRYLLGTLRLFGGLQNAASVMLHSYWSGVFEELGGALGTSNEQRIVDTLQKKLRTIKAPVEGWNDDTWGRVAGIVASEAQNVRIPTTALTFNQLRQHHAPFLEREKAALEKHEVEEAKYWLEQAEKSVGGSVQRLCSKKVLFQGYEWQCDTCFNNNWNDISALQPQLTCAVCGTSEPAPVQEPWSFRLNGFLKDAMREHGVLALIWCLRVLEERSRTSFFFLGPHNLWVHIDAADQGKRQDNEADLLCVVDRRVHLCEVKSSRRDIDLASLIDVATRLRPDVVTLAVMEPITQRLKDKLAELQSSLSGTGIVGELLTLETRDDDRNDAHLP